MRKIRKGIFETNSSSTHAIVIPKQVNEDNYNVYDSLDHDYGFGRQECRLIEYWDEKLAYIYIALKEKETRKDIDEFKIRVNKIWSELADKKISPTPTDLFNYLDRDGNDGDLTGNDGVLMLIQRWGNYVDHSNELYNIGLIDRIKNDDDFLKRLIFNRESYITIGGDEYRGYNIKTIGFEYDYEYDYINNEIVGDFWGRLEEYKKDNDVFLKGN